MTQIKAKRGDWRQDFESSLARHVAANDVLIAAVYVSQDGEINLDLDVRAEQVLDYVIDHFMAVREVIKREAH